MDSHPKRNFLLVCLLWWAPILQAQSNRILVGHSALLPQSEGMRLATQCSRRGVSNVQATWVPSANQLTEMEIELSKFLASKHPKILKSSEKLYLQYAGFVVNGRPIIYINAINEFHVHPPFTDEPVDWKNVAMKFCDGGHVFWGLEYDPISKSFSNMAFNGNA